MAQTLTIGQVARATGVAAKTIRYYEQIGVLPVPRRASSGYRQYDQAAIERLRFVSRARALALPLHRLRTLTIALNGGPTVAVRPKLLALVEEQLVAVQHQIADLAALRRQLQNVSNRMRMTPRRRPNAACRCLETSDRSQRIAGRPTGARPSRR